MKIRPTAMKNSSIKKFNLLKKSKSKTWALSQSQPATAEPQDAGLKHASERQPELLALPYEATADPKDEPAETKNPYVYHLIASSPAPAPVENEQETVSQPPSEVLLSKSPLPKRVNSVKKMTSFLRLKTAKTEPATSPSSSSPTVLEQIIELADDETHEASDNSSTAAAPTLPHYPTSSTLSPHTATFTTFTSSSTTPTTPITPFSPLDSNHPSDTEDEPQISSTKHEIRALKLADLSSTRNALSLAHTAHTTGLSTLSLLHAQNERLANADRKVYDAGVQTRIATERIRTLKTARRFVAVENPFLAGRKTREGDDAALSTHRAEREERDGLRRGRWEEAFRKRVMVEVVVPGTDGQVARVVERAKYQFEPDGEDDWVEEEIEGELEEMAAAVPRLKEVALHLGQAVEEGNRRLDGMRERMDGVDDGVVRNRYALERVH